MRRPDKTLATADHNVPTDGTPAARLIADEMSRKQVETLERNCAQFGVPVYSLGSNRRGIVHVIGPELGLTQPGTDDRLRRLAHVHTRRLRSVGVRHRHLGGRARARHPVPVAEASRRRCGSSTSASCGPGVTPKDLILATIGRLGTHGMIGYAVEYAGERSRRLSMEGRMTMCNMTIEGGGRAGMVAPDDTTFAYVEGRPGAPEDFDRAVEGWRELQHGRGRRVRLEGRDRRLGDLTDGHLGNPARAGGRGDRPRYPIPTPSTPRPIAKQRSAHSPTWRWSRARR